MKKILMELSYDDQTKKFDLVSQFSLSDVLNQNALDEKQMNVIIDGLVETILDKKDIEISKILKSMTIADICSDVQPYDHIVQLWMNMMFSYLPAREKVFRKMKERRGMHVKVHEPVTCVNPDALTSGKSKLS